MNKEEKKCKGCSCWCSCYDEDGDQTPKYCDACGGYYRERAEELQAEVESMNEYMSQLEIREHQLSYPKWKAKKAKAEGGKR